MTTSAYPITIYGTSKLLVAEKGLDALAQLEPSWLAARFGRVFASWPFARFDIADDYLTLRSWPLSRRMKRSASRRSIDAVNIALKYFRVQVTIEDQDGAFRNGSIEVPYRLTAIKQELGVRGYPVIDRR